MVEFDYEELVKATENFKTSRLIGKGSHGLVYKGKLKDNKLVAIKKQSNGLQSLCDNSKLDNEIHVLSTLRKNPNVISFLGTSHDSLIDNKLLVMEFMPNASLHDLLHNSAEHSPTWPKRVEIAMQIARAIQFLHEGKPLVIHRDIKSTNVLFDSNWNAKLADFGLAVLPVDSLSQVSCLPAGTIGYLDPSYTTPNKLSTKNVIFSFGVLLLEITSSRKVIDVDKSPASLVEWAIPLIKRCCINKICDSRIALPTYMVGTITHILRLAARCVSPYKHLRPSINEVIGVMENCSIERVRLPIWTSFLRCIIILRKRGRKLNTHFERKCAAKEGDVHNQVSNRKLLVKEVLALG